METSNLDTKTKELLREILTNPTTVLESIQICFIDEDGNKIDNSDYADIELSGNYHQNTETTKVK